MKQSYITISQVVAQLEAIRAEHGDLPCYTFYEYEESVAHRQVSVNAIIESNPYDGWKFPHVQIS